MIEKSEHEKSSLDYQKNIFHPLPVLPPYNKACKLYVDLLPETYTKQQLLQLINPFGKIEACQLERDRSAGANISFGYVIFQKEESVSRVIEKVKHTKEGKDFYLGVVPDTRRGKNVKKKRNRRSENRKSGNLKFRGLPLDCTESKLRELVSPYGYVGFVKIEHDITEIIGIVHMGNGDIAESVKNALHGLKPHGSSEPLHVSFASSLKSSSKICEQMDLLKICLPGGIEFYDYC